jgi:hypothetical protein
MSDYDLYPGQNCPCGNDSGCTNCGSGAEAERQWLEWQERREAERIHQEEWAREMEAQERAQIVRNEGSEG